MKRVTLRGGISTLLAVLAAYRLSRRVFDRERLSRGALIRLGGAALTALATAGLRARSKATAAPSCVLSPEQTEGPYYVPREKIRSNITEKRPGTPLQLRINVVDAASCRPIKGAAVDIWHCDAGGIYSGFIAASTGGAPGGGAGPTDKSTFLRGVQFTNARGLAVFRTIYPGWYRGRTVHIHVKVHLGGANGHVVHTGQLYFSDNLTAKVYQVNPYRARAAERDTFNATDGIYRDGGAQSMLTIKRNGTSGYIGEITLGVRRT